MTCKDLQDSIPDYLAGALSSDELGHFHGHLAECESCRMELEQTQSMWRTLGELPDEEPSPRLRSHFYSLLEEEKRRVAKELRDPWPRRLEAWLNSWWPRRPAVQMAMTAALLIVGVIVGRGIQSAPETDVEFQQLQTEVQQMHEMVSLSLLNGNSSSDRLRGVNWTSRVDQPSADLLESLMNTLDSDPNENVRMAAVDALGRFSDQPVVVDVLTGSLSRETSPMVQIALIDLLIAVQEKKALEALRDFVEMQSVVPEVRAHAEKGMSGTL
ncbi:MAG: HEAT repeat domain-containing protein [Candidatus Latescibacterota bacterium]|nr:MAG: HEAT repeat domain-containing protein [Candidatus Latescibacterota bacterium]